MTEHFNVQIKIQRVRHETVTRPLASNEKSREIVNILDLAVTADTEVEAYAKAHRMLNANEAVPVPQAMPDGSVHYPPGVRAPDMR